MFNTIQNFFIGQLSDVKVFRSNFLELKENLFITLIFVYDLKKIFSQQHNLIFIYFFILKLISH